jgi:hypothetical protein
LSIGVNFGAVTCCCLGLECLEFDLLLLQMEIFSNLTSPLEKGLEIELQNLNLGLGFGFGFIGSFLAGVSSTTDLAALGTAGIGLVFEEQ